MGDIIGDINSRRGQVNTDPLTHYATHCTYTNVVLNVHSMHSIMLYRTMLCASALLCVQIGCSEDSQLLSASTFVWAVLQHCEHA
jgi:hypothetical protein